ncbi:MAG: hypothetical protein DWQ47_10325 [Acidobacteria bacterium]|nr:MAG: hypothetical protein DWQ32_12740 [Acidobacteriota bacterium]REJ97980.1 MAG: hypothetical protein DWQ38_15540 [Acidobacteriota bacterium]REK16723.1 MAG: hypothetical protein DWQ43_00585 [Acidobacteriota bacterium]REK42634.1 MAG: hypothetical protein DWQ47_10325 [Acidobacteriota bacterium]
MKRSVLSLFAFAAVALLAVSASAGEFCSNKNYYGGDKESAVDLREMTIPSTGSIDVDSGKNGGIAVKGENRSDVLVRACVRSWADTGAEAKNIVDTTRIETSPTIRATNSGESSKYSVSFEILVPYQTSLKLRAHNGGISIKSVQGDMDFSTLNGGLSLTDVAGDVKGRTTNGGVKVSLVGTTWSGTGLDVQTTNGGVKLALPTNYAANIETGTVNGGFKSDFPELQVQKDPNQKYYQRNKNVSASLNGGGALIRVKTTNGGVKIGAADGVEQ